MKQILHRLSNLRRASTKLLEIGVDDRVAQMPKVLWIELTSKCPFDCIFCSRQTLRGVGQHMPFELYQSIIGELLEPEIIRLNYSGESVHHPQIIEAIQLASRTGATVELVSAFASLPENKIEGLVKSGLDRLSISIHTMDSDQYSKIYRFSSLEQLKRKINLLQEIKRRTQQKNPILDFAFVAMQQNINQITEVAAYASELGINELAIHPVINRDQIPATFADETDGNSLNPAFKQSLDNALQIVERRFPKLQINISTPEIYAETQLDDLPRRFPFTLPEGAAIHSCDQNPWETVHILAHGDVVVCEVKDKITIGNLHEQSLREIWHGERYRKFRQQFSFGHDKNCRVCPYKTAYFPNALVSKIAFGQKGQAQLHTGWHESTDPGIIWSKQNAELVLGNFAMPKKLHLRGLLPPNRETRKNRLDVICNGDILGHVFNAGTELLSFEIDFPLIHRKAAKFYIKLRTETLHRPSAGGNSSDNRLLGFALQQIELK